MKLLSSIRTLLAFVFHRPRIELEVLRHHPQTPSPLGYQHAAVRQPSQTGRRAVEPGNHRAVAVGRHAQHLVPVHVGDPERALVPARPLKEGAVIDERRDLGHCVRSACWR